MIKDKDDIDQFKRIIEEINKHISNILKNSDFEYEPLIYGFSVKIGSDGIPHIENIGNMNFNNTDDNTREPFTSTIIDEKKNEFKITAEMPGIEKKDIDVRATENYISIKAENKDRKYYKKIKAPRPIKPEVSCARYNNGILEICFEFKKSEEKKINID